MGTKDAFQDFFDDLEDPRVERTKLYPLIEIIFVVICGMICGADSWRDFVIFGESKLPYLKRFFLFKHGIPSKNTFARVMSSINPEQFKKCFLDIDDKMLMNFVVFLNEKKHLSSKTIKDHVSALSSFFEYCCLRFYLTFNPAKSQQLRQMITRYLRSIRKNSTRIREKSRTAEEIHSLLKVAFEHSYEFGVATAFVFVTGIRLGEIAALTWADFILDDADNYYCLINKTLNPIDKSVSKHAKSGSDGYLPVPSSLRKHLEVLKMKHADGTDSVFPFIRRNQDGFSRILGKLSKSINARRITAHLLRHSFVSYLGTHDVNLQTAQKAARHSKISMTEAYFNASYLGLDKVAKTMECFLSNVSMPNVSQLKNWDNPLGQSLQQANI